MGFVFLGPHAVKVRSKIVEKCQKVDFFNILCSFEFFWFSIILLEILLHNIIAILSMRFFLFNHWTLFKKKNQQIWINPVSFSIFLLNLYIELHSYPLLWSYPKMTLYRISMLDITLPPEKCKVTSKRHNSTLVQSSSDIAYQSLKGLCLLKAMLSPPVRYGHVCVIIIKLF